MNTLTANKVKINMCLISIKLFIVRTYKALFPTYATIRFLLVIHITKLFDILLTLLLS